MRKAGALVTCAFDVVQCIACSLVYVSPRIASSDIPRLYDDAYYEGHGFDRTVSYAANAEHGLMTSENQAAFESLTETISVAGKRVLDVGCGNGTLLKKMQANGAIVQGVETSSAGRAICDQIGVPIVAGSVFDAALDDEKYDVVTAIEVIEHVTSPTAFLDRLRSLLAPDGVLYLSTGNWNLLRREPGTPYIMPEGHIYYFSPTTMRRYFQKVGLAEDARFTNYHWAGWRYIPFAKRRFMKPLVRLLSQFVAFVLPGFGPFPVARISSKMGVTYDGS